jgi:hypothetical protein
MRQTGASPRGEDWNVSSVQTIQVPKKRELECVWCHMQKNFKIHQKYRESLYLLHGATCPNRGFD